MVPGGRRDHYCQASDVFESVTILGCAAVGNGGRGDGSPPHWKSRRAPSWLPMATGRTMNAQRQMAAARRGPFSRITRTHQVQGQWCMVNPWDSLGQPEEQNKEQRLLPADSFHRGMWRGFYSNTVTLTQAKPPRLASGYGLVF